MDVRWVQKTEMTVILYVRRPKNQALIQRRSEKQYRNPVFAPMCIVQCEAFVILCAQTSNTRMFSKNRFNLW